jgi:hypothetical protein
MTPLSATLRGKVERHRAAWDAYMAVCNLPLAEISADDLRATRETWMDAAASLAFEAEANLAIITDALARVERRAA